MEKQAKEKCTAVLVFADESWPRDQVVSMLVFIVIFR